MPARIVFETCGVSKRFGLTQAVRTVSARFVGGEVHCLLGENGAGKSTLGKIIGGVMTPDDGTLKIDGKPVQFRSVRDARRQGVAVAFQELSLAPHLTVADNISLGTEHGRNPWRRIRRRQEDQACRVVLADLDFDVDPERRVASLSVAEQQLVEVAKALAHRPRLLILDEPTAMLGLTEKRRLLALVRRLRRDGLAIILVTHHVDDVLEVADQVSLMRDGAVVETFAVTPQTDAHALVDRLVGRRLPQESERPAAPVGRDVLATLTGLPGLGEIVIGRGEIVGLYGVAGCGREQIADALVGLRRHEAMTATLNGRRYQPRSPSGAARHGVGYLPSGRAANCILPTRSIAENLMLGIPAGRLGLIRGRRERARIAERLAQLQVRFSHADDLITSLSGGNQQKVVLGRSLGRAGALLVLEDPTVGIDLGAKHEIHAVVRAQAAAGLSVVLLSGDLLETIALCDTIYTICSGRVVARTDNPTLADEARLVADVLDAPLTGHAAAVQEPHHASG